MWEKQLGVLTHTPVDQVSLPHLLTSTPPSLWRDVRSLQSPKRKKEKQQRQQQHSRVRPLRNTVLHGLSIAARFAGFRFVFSLSKLPPLLVSHSKSFTDHFTHSHIQCTHTLNSGNVWLAEGEWGRDHEWRMRGVGRKEWTRDSHKDTYIIFIGLLNEHWSNFQVFIWASFRAHLSHVMGFCRFNQFPHCSQS